MPNSDKTDAGRSNMFASSIPQTVILNNPERPLVFSNFENQVGEYSSGFLQAEQDYLIIGHFESSSDFTLYVIGEDDVVDQIVIPKEVKHITESYGYKVINYITQEILDSGEIKKGTLIFANPCYDRDLNFRFGVNLVSVFLPWKGMTFEDAVVISRSASRKLTHRSSREIFVTINTNDLLINWMGDSNYFQAFPEVGESIKNRILCGRRRVTYESLLVEMSDTQLRNFQEDDVLFQLEGKVAKIEVFCNDAEHLRKYKYNEQLFKYYNEGSEINETLVDLMQQAHEANLAYSDDLGYAYSRALNADNEDIKWSFDKSQFDVAVIKFTIYKDSPAVIGSKITNRYGGKGVVSLILPDSEMPTTEDGEVLDVILNPLGVVNRLNLSQLYEHELNHLGDQILDSVKDEPSSIALETILGYIKDVNPKQYEFFAGLVAEMDGPTQEALVQEFHAKGIPLEQAPFFGNIEMQQMWDLFSKYNFQRKKVVGIEKPLVVGKMYLIKLKHEPYSKFSARSAKQISMKEIPVRNNQDYKHGRALHSSTPVRLGEQELINLLVLNDPEQTYRFLGLMSNNKVDRQKVIKEILTVPNLFNIEELESSNTPSKTAEVVYAYLAGIGVKLDFSKE